MKNRKYNFFEIFRTNKWLIPISIVIFILLGCKNEKPEIIGENEYYVCSMDPQVMEKHAGMCPICKMPLAKVEIDKNDINCIKINNDQARLANIKVAPIETSTIGKQRTLNGLFVVNQNKTEQISGRIKGRIEHLYFKTVGALINKGDKIYDLYSRELLEAQEEYLLALEKGKLLKVESSGMVSASKNKLRLWGMTDEQILELEKSNQPKNTITIFSKVTGTITEIPIKEGDYINEGDEIYKTADLNTLWVEAQLYTDELSNLNIGQEVDIIPEPFPDDHIKGKIVFSNPELQRQTKISIVRIEVSNSKQHYKPGMQAYILLSTQQKEALVLPIDAVIQNQGNSIVWIKTGEKTFEPRKVETGIQTIDKIEIAAGLKQGEQVVISGTYLLNSEYVFKKGMNPMDNTMKQVQVENKSDSIKIEKKIENNTTENMNPNMKM